MGCFSDDCRRAVALNLRGYTKLAQGAFSSRINAAFATEELVEHFFSVVTFHGGHGSTRLNQLRLGGAYRCAVLHWLRSSWASGTVLSQVSESSVVYNKVYQRRTHARAIGYDPVVFRLDSRKTKSRGANKQLQKIASSLRGRLGVTKQARVRPATSLWRADGFAALSSRLRPTEFTLHPDAVNEEAALFPHPSAGDDEDHGDAATGQPSDLIIPRQGDDVCVNPAANCNDPFWLCRVVNADDVQRSGMQQKISIIYYELIDGEAGLYRLDPHPTRVALLGHCCTLCDSDRLQRRVLGVGRNRQRADPACEAASAFYCRRSQIATHCSVGRFPAHDRHAQ